MKSFSENDMTKKEHILNILEQFEKFDLSDSSKKKNQKGKNAKSTKKTDILQKINYFLKKMFFFIYLLNKSYNHQYNFYDISNNNDLILFSHFFIVIPPKFIAFWINT